jgi:rod shape-determining protein MreD
MATLVCGFSQLVLLALFSSAGGIVVTLLFSLIPQSLVNALAASLIFSLLDRPVTEESG